MRIAVVAVMLMFFCAPLSATVFTSTGTGNWNDGGTWGNTSPGTQGVDWPADADSAVIAGSTTVTLTGDATIHNLTVDSGTTLNMDGNKLVIDGDLVINGDIVADNADIEFHGSNISGSGGTCDLGGGTFKLKDTNTTFLSGCELVLTCQIKMETGDIDITNNGTITVTDGVIKKNAGNIWTNAANSVANVAGQFLDNGQIDASADSNTVNYNGSANQNVYTPLSSYHHLSLSGSGEKTLTGNTDVNGDVLITSATFKLNNLDLSVGGDFTNNGVFTQGSGTVTFDGTSTVGGSTTTTFPNLTISGTLTAHPTQMNVEANMVNNGTFNHNNGTVNFSGTTALSGSSVTSFCGVRISDVFTAPSGNMNVACSWVNNGTFTNNGGAVTFNGSTVISGSATNSFHDLSITDSLTAPASDNINVAGDWNNNAGTFIHNSGTVTFNGSGVIAASLDHTGDGDFYNLTINSTIFGNALTVNNSILILNALTLTDGIILSGNDTISLNAATTLSGVSDASYIDGYVAKKTNSTSSFTFPVGSDLRYRWIRVTPTSSNATTFTARYHFQEQNLGASVGTGLVNVSAAEYWELDRSGASPANATIVLTWDVYSDVGVPADLRVAQWDTSDWVDRGNVSTTGNATAGTITSNTITSFFTGNFTLSSVSLDNPLVNKRYSVVPSGYWSDTSSWSLTSGGASGASVPTAFRTAVIEGGSTITLTDNSPIFNLIVDSGCTLNDSAFVLTIGNRLELSGEINADDKDIIFNGTSISGIGGVCNLGTNKFKMNGTVTTFEDSCDVTFLNELKIESDDVDVVNYGTVTVDGSINKKNGGNIWTNAANAVVNVAENFMDGNQIDVSADSNTVNYNGTVDQNVRIPITSYYHLTLSGEGVKKLNGDTDVNGDILITNAEFKLDNRALNLAGDFTDNGTFTEGTGAVTFDGDSNQTLTVTSGEEQFYDVIVNKSNGQLLLNDQLSIVDNGTMTFTKGIIASSTGNEVLFYDGAMTNGGDDDSYVDGPVIKVGNDAFTFPTGDGSVWARIGISAPDDATDEFVATYNYTPHPDTSVNGIAKVSWLEYWQLDENNDAGSATSVNITLHWESAMRSDIQDYSSDLVVAHYDGSGDWVDAGQSAISGTDPGSVTSNSVSAFSPFSFGSKNGLNTLPIELLGFEALAEHGQVKLRWSTAVEINNDYFTIERSDNAREWESIMLIEGAGNSWETLLYEKTDLKPLSGTSYYRLKQTDFDGTSTYSDVESVTMYPYEPDFLADRASIRLFPNPIRSGNTLSVEQKHFQSEKLTIELRHITGQVIYATDVRIHGPQDRLINLPIGENHSPGLYWVLVKSGDQQAVRKLIIR